jgi:hypothetical protein
MAKKQQQGVNQSAAIREVLTANPNIKAKEVVEQLAEKGITTKVGLVYIIKGKLEGRKSRKKRAQKLVEKVEATANGKPTRDQTVSEILKVKNVAKEVGGMARLKIIVDAMIQE